MSDDIMHARLDGLIDCGCMVDNATDEGGGVAIVFCALHASASGLLEAAEKIADWIDASVVRGMGATNLKLWGRTLRAAIKQARS